MLIIQILCQLTYAYFEYQVTLTLLPNYSDINNILFINNFKKYINQIKKWK